MTVDIVDARARLRLPFPPSQVGRLPRGGVTLEYVGHGAVRSRLLDVDPEWNWEPCCVDEQGRPLFELDGEGNPVGFWIKLTVLGVTRLGYGSCPGSQFEAEKVLIGDALRNAAMSFGVALDLWVNGHSEDDEQVSAQDTRQRPARRQSGPRLCLVCGKSMAGETNPHRSSEGFSHAACVEVDDKVPAGEEPF